MTHTPRIGAVAALLLGSGLFAAPPALIVLDLPAQAKGKAPEGWRLKITHGMPDVQGTDEGAGDVVHLRSKKSSYGLERALEVDPALTPFLSWKWKVTELPAGGDFRRLTSDDQAAQVLVAFADRRILTYIWDTTAPVGTVESASRIPFVHIRAFVLRSGESEINQWLTETRNVAEDYARVYGKAAPLVKGIRLQINSQHTGTSAESYFGGISFRNIP